jgi:hypothetical protein
MAHTLREKEEGMAESGTRGGLTFGIYPGSAIGHVVPPGPADCPDRITQALDLLQGGDGRPFVVRAYHAFVDPADAVHTATQQTPADYERYAGRGRKLDLVVQYHSRSGDVEGYCGFIERLIARHGPILANIQIAEEPNITDDPYLDGSYPGVTEAIIAGVHTAREAAIGEGYADLRVGCNSAPLLGADVSFFSDLTRVGGERFVAELDYVGLDFFPDVFRPITPDRLPAVVEGLLRSHRRDVLAPAGLGDLPLVITEHGWPTGPARPVERQVEVVRAVLEVIGRNAEELNITGYTHHSLRDSRSAGHGLFSRFGLMTDDYSPKPAFHAYRELIATLAP